MSADRPLFDRDLSRRQVLQMLGVGAAGAALAACGGGTGGGGGGSNPTKEFHGAWPYDVPPNGHFNIIEGMPHAILFDIGAIYADIILPPLAMYYWKDKKWMTLLAEKWGFDAGASTFSVTLKKGLKWEDGSPLTSKDLVTSLWMVRIMRNVTWDYIDSVKATDDYTVVSHMSTPSTVVERYVLKRHVYSDATYGPFAKRAQDLFAAGKNLDSAEGKKLVEDFQSFRPAKIIASGPFQIDYNSITNSQLTLVKNKSGLLANQVQFEKCVIYNGETPVVTPIVLDKKVDYATHGFPPATAKQFTQENIRVLRPPVYNGYGMAWNIGKYPEFADKRVRQAFAHAINRAQSATVTMGESAKPVKYMAGFSDLQVPDWLSQSDISKLNTYSFDANKATQLLTAAGWKKNGSQWMKPDGTAAEYELLFPAEYSDSSAAGQDAATQLTKFGIKVTPRSETFTQQPIDIDKGNFQLATLNWGSSTSPHPHFAFYEALFHHNIPIAANNGGQGIGFPLKQHTDALGDVDLEKLTVNSALGLDENAQKKDVATAAVAFNELLPLLPLSERFGDNPALEHTRVQSWPADSDSILYNAPYGDNFTIMLMYRGDLKPV